MVDVANITRAQGLVGEHQSIVAALERLDEGGRIVAMSIADAADAPVMTWVTVPTSFIEYPPQMVTSIKSALSARRDAIQSELAKLGITGV